MKPRKQERKRRTCSNLEESDLSVLGSATGDKLIPWATTKAGMKVANIERKYVDGSWQNTLSPSTNVIHSAKVAPSSWRDEEFGITREN